MCLWCRESEAISARGYCVHCSFVVRAEVENGLRRLGEYLAAWMAFERWCAEHNSLIT
jgi:hypothetical protein